MISAAASACGGDDDEAEARPRRTTTTERETTITTLDPRAAEEQAVIAAYEAAVQARAESSAPPTPDPSHPSIAATHTGFMLDYWMATVEALQATGVAYSRPDASVYRSEVDSVRFEDVDGRRIAYLEVCTVTDEEQILVETGAVVTGGVRTVQASDALVQEEGAWKLAEHRENVTLEGVAGCAAD